MTFATSEVGRRDWIRNKSPIVVEENDHGVFDMWFDTKGYYQPFDNLIRRRYLESLTSFALVDPPLLTLSLVLFPQRSA